jgi:hypothetical protein
MPLSGTRLRDAEKAGILAQLQSLFPVSGALQAAEQTLLNTAQNKIAEAIAFGGAPATVAEITGNAALANGLVTTGTGTGGIVTGGID